MQTLTLNVGWASEGNLVCWNLTLTILEGFSMELDGIWPNQGDMKNKWIKQKYRNAWVQFDFHINLNRSCLRQVFPYNHWQQKNSRKVHEDGQICHSKENKKLKNEKNSGGEGCYDLC